MEEFIKCLFLRQVRKMADEQTREEIIRQGARENLESKLIQNLVGSSRVLNPQAAFKYGQLGVQSAQVTYDSLVNGGEIGELRDREYQERVQEGKSLGIHGEPSYPTNYDLTAKRAIILEQSKVILTLGDLAEIVYSVAGKFGFKLPELSEELSGYTAAELDRKSKSKRGLTKREEAALVLYSHLSQTYDRGISDEASWANRYEDANEAIAEIAKKYQPGKPGNGDDGE